MADKKISELDLAARLEDNAEFPLSQENGGTPTTYKTKTTDLGAKINEDMTFSNLTTDSKKIVGAINELKAGGGGGSGGHTIVDDDGTSLTQRSKLQFKGAYSVDDSTNSKTVVNVVREMTKAQFNQLSSDEKTGLINISDESLNATEIPITDGSQTNTKSYIDSGLNGKVDTTDFDATNLPITSGSATNTKDYIDSKTSNIPTIEMGLSTQPLVDGATYQIPNNVLSHRIVIVELFRYGYCGSITFFIDEITTGSCNGGVRLYAYSSAKEFKISNSGVITALTGFGTDGLNVRTLGIF